MKSSRSLLQGQVALWTHLWVEPSAADLARQIKFDPQHPTFASRAVVRTHRSACRCFANVCCPQVPLEVALQASAPWQASRGFAALLQLVNAGNVALRVAGASDGVGGVLCAAGDLSLVLLSREDRSEHFGDYRAPSVAVGNGALAPTSRLNREERLLTRGGKPAAEVTAVHV